MQFKHPEILYFLFLLVIPIIVHLFQLRRFKKEYFTNVKLLKELQIQTTKSSKIKKWLLLATRLLLLTALIFAFARPFFKSNDALKEKNELVVLLDNSFSMQAKGSKGELLKRALQEIIEETPENKNISLLTCNETFWEIDVKLLKNELLNLNYTSQPFEVDNLIAKVEAKMPNVAVDYVIISDGIQTKTERVTNLDKANSLFYYNLEAQNKNNISIENVTLSQTLDNFYEIKIDLKAYGEIENDIPLSLIDNGQSIAKTRVKFPKNEQSVLFTIPKKDFHGYASIQDNALNYDNTFYLSIEKPKKLKITAIGTPEKNNFLSKIYTEDEFDFQSYTTNTINYNELENQNCIILNELDEIPPSLAVNLQSFYQKGGNCIIIPSETVSLNALNSLLNTLGLGSFSSLEKNPKKITKISFDHPVFSNVFEKRVTNFQYPETKQNYSSNQNNLAVLSYEDGSAFLSNVNNQIGSLYLFSAAINKQNSNFQNSPLIVPTFYNMGQTKGTIGTLAHTIGENQAIIIDAITSKDNVLSIKNDTESFIPMQQLLNSKIKLTLGEFPQKSGNFGLYDKNNLLKKLSFNYKRTESDLNQEPNSNLNDLDKVSSLETLFNELESGRTAKELWKWLIILALVFLLAELAIQKFVK